MTLHHYKTLGRTGLRVSPLALGTMTFGEEWGWGSSVADSIAILKSYLDAGGNFIDTANVYTKGHSEQIIGDFFKENPQLRDRAVIATKFCGNLFPGDPNAGGAGAKAIYSQCEGSLRRLQTDYIDLYWMHQLDKFTPIEETLRALDDLVRSGKVRYVGLSDTPAWICAQAQLISQIRGYLPIAAIQVEYSLLERTVEGELLPMAEHFGMGVTPWSPLKYGVLSGKYTRANRDQVVANRGAGVEKNLTEKTYEVIDRLLDVAKELDTSPARVALAWIQAQHPVTSSIIGARTLEQLSDNIGALTVHLSTEQLSRLHEVSLPKLNFPYDFNRRSTPMFSYGGCSINGELAPEWPLAPKSDSERW